MTNSNGKLFFIPADASQPVREVLPEEYGKLEYGTPTFEFMRPALKCDTIEHLSVRWQRRPAHLFFDEEGLLHEPKGNNERATAIFANTILWQRTRDARTERVVYDDLTQPAPLGAMMMFAVFGVLIVGDAFLWTGDME